MQLEVSLHELVREREVFQFVICMWYFFSPLWSYQTDSILILCHYECLTFAPAVNPNVERNPNPNPNPNPEPNLNPYPTPN